MDLFRSAPIAQPLAARLRATNLDEYVGQQHLLARGKPLREALEQGALHSMIFWGPPGVGKTTLARLLAEVSDAHFETVSAVLAGVKEIRQAVEIAKQQAGQYGRRTILFVDEVHRFNKSQQDAFLPYVEDGTLIFIGATTENPSFELNNALLSRARVYVLKSLDEAALGSLVQRALTEERGLGKRQLSLSDEGFQMLLSAADGDGRRMLNLLENASDLAEDGGEIGVDLLQSLLGDTRRRFDKGGEAFYDQISALHKSVRGSNPDGALYWFARMLDGGCDPLYLARRVVRMASEDIGNADPRALRPVPGGLGRARAPGQPRGRAGGGAGHHLPGLRAEEQRRVHGLQGRHARRCRARFAGSADPPAQCPDQADEAVGLWRRIPLRPR